MNFIFENKEIKYDLEEENGVIAVRPTFTAAKKVKDFVEVLGRNGAVTKDTGVYEAKEITVPLTFINYDLNNFRLFELEGQSGKLYFPNYWNDGTYFEVVNATEIEIEDNYGVGESSIAFTLQPFRMSDYKSIIIINNTNFIVNGTIDTKPILEIKATGDVSFSINGEGVNIRNVEGSIIIDLEKLEIYKKNSDGTKIEQGSKVISMNIKKIKLLAKNKQNKITDLTSNVTEFKVTYRENWI